jgi:hypothetical protein
LCCFVENRQAIPGLMLAVPTLHAQLSALAVSTSEFDRALPLPETMAG